ncbi:type II toxin-antitoxin system VapC family toxin [Rhodopila sp.]|uniref:type II toxin-antitoxin system VapC family toxin n=1 Tax=Rhodopila sp. TaxID=2480087 RepID=UPI003D14F5B8
MIIDASALLAIVLGEPDAALFARAIPSEHHPRMPCVTWFEAAMRTELAGDAVAVSRSDDFPKKFGIDIIPFTARHAEAARLGRRLYGRPHHPAGLNFGDCLVYGVARSEREPLLFKGVDFARTDVQPALKG